jgi:hypothetical protein
MISSLLSVVISWGGLEVSKLDQIRERAIRNAGGIGGSGGRPQTGSYSVDDHVGRVGEICCFPRTNLELTSGADY